MIERIEKGLKVASDRLRAGWAQECLKYPLDEAGDALRRDAATRAAVLEDVLKGLKSQLRKQEI